MNEHTLTILDDIISKAKSHCSTNVASHRHANARMVQNILLIWLDSNINEENDVDCRNTIIQLRAAANTIETFTDGEECIKFINNMTDEKACMIISGSLGQHIVPRVHDMSHVDSIFIFCGNKNLHELWIKKWSKIKGVFTEISPICEALKQAVEQCEQNSISVSYVTTSDDECSKHFDKLNPSYIFTQILKEIILTIEFEEKHIKQFFDYCRDVLAGNESELKNLDHLEQKYHEITPVSWYIYECFLYSMLNRGLRLVDVNIITKTAFFISNIHRQIERLHKEQFNGCQAGHSFTVYHGQGLSKLAFEQMTKTKNGFISFNNFLCTSKDRKVSFNFAHRAIANSHLVGIFFVITIDPCKSRTPFAFINSVDNSEEKNEVLFPMHTVFRIREIQSMGEHNRLFQVDLTLTDDNDEDLRTLTNYIREETFPNSKGWDRLGQLLIKMGQFDKAQQVYDFILEQTTDEIAKVNIYHQLGRIKNKQRVYKEAITLYEKSIEIHKKTLPSTHPDLAASYDNIALVYYNMGEYPKALQFYEKALEIEQKILHPNHSDLAAAYNKIGLVYFKMNHSLKALPFYERAKNIEKHSSPSSHPHLEKWCKNLDFLQKKV